VFFSMTHSCQVVPSHFLKTRKTDELQQKTILVVVMEYGDLSWYVCPRTGTFLSSWQDPVVYRTNLTKRNSKTQVAHDPTWTIGCISLLSRGGGGGYR
jgi:hypothetical protein